LIVDVLPDVTYFEMAADVGVYTAVTLYISFILGLSFFLNRRTEHKAAHVEAVGASRSHPHHVDGQPHEFNEAKTARKNSWLWASHSSVALPDASLVDVVCTNQKNSTTEQQQTSVT
jgi:hypothetical protein